MTTTELPSPSVMHGAPPAPWPVVRMAMPTLVAERLAEHLIDVRGTLRETVLCEQLWLRTVLMEQRRRTVTGERTAFDAQADRLLAALDPPPQVDRAPVTRP